MRLFRLVHQVGPPGWSTWLPGSTQVHLTPRPYIRQSANGQEGGWRERGSNWSKYKKFWMFSRLQIYTCESMHHAAYLCRCRNIQVCRSVMWKYESASVKVYNLKIKVCKRKCASMHCMCTCMQMCKYASMQVCRWRAQPKVPRREDPVRAGWISPPHNPTLTFKIQFAFDNHDPLVSLFVWWRRAIVFCLLACLWLCITWWFALTCM